MSNTRYNNATLSALSAKTTPLYLRQNPTLNLMEENGCIEWGKHGNSITEEYEASADSLNFASYEDFEELSIAPGGDPVQAVVPWANLKAQDALAGIQKRNNGGTEGRYDSGKVRDLRDKIINDLMTGMRFKFNAEIQLGAGGSVGGGGGQTLTGIQTWVSLTPSSGTIAGVSRSAYSDYRNIQIAGNSGPTGVFSTDSWERFVTLVTQCTTPWTSSGTMACPDLALFTKANFVTVINRGLNQNTNVGTDVKGIKSILGTELHIEENVAANTFQVLTSKTWKLSTPFSKSKDGLFQLRTKNNLDAMVDDDDEIYVVKFHGALRCIFPHANGICTAA
jgi:hypothetical protein